MEFLSFIEKAELDEGTVLRYDCSDLEKCLGSS